MKIARHAVRRVTLEGLERRDLLSTVTIDAAADTSLYEDGLGLLSNGAGEFLFAGRTKQVEGRRLRRALVRFDLADQIPAGATINDVSLSMHLSRTISNEVPVSLHRLTNVWGEGASDAQGPEGKGADVAPGDATWLHTSFPTELWVDAGGDFVAAASATTNVGSQAQAYIWSAEGMAADVNAWLQNPQTNFGWILIGGESIEGSAKRFNSREHADAATRPRLTVDFSEPAGLPSIRVDDASVAEGNETSLIAFTVTLSEQPTQAVSVDFSTTPDGNATANGDYVAISGTLTFSPGDPLSKQIEVQVVGDLVTEDDEVFELQLSNASGANLIDAVATGTIENDDPPPTISIPSIQEDEGNNQISVVSVPVQLSNPSSFEVTVDFFTAASTAQQDDYIDLSTTLTFAPGETSQIVQIEVIGDEEVEPDEDVNLVLSNPVNGVIAGGDAAVLTIVNDDLEPSPWQNTDLDLDVSGDGQIVPRDALIIINYINANGPGVLPAPGPNGPPPFYDVNGDSLITPNDALRIIFFLNTNPQGESNPPPPAAVDWLLAFSWLDSDRD